MILLSDNDLIIKLAQCDLIDEALSALGASRNNCYVLDTLKYSLRLKSPDIAIQRHLGTAQAFDRINDFLGSCIELPAAPAQAEFIDHLYEVPEIDPGEFALFLHAHHYFSHKEDFRLLTGDKRALKAICEYVQFDAFAFLRTKIVCLESCMLNIIDLTGFEHVNQKIIKTRSEIETEKFDKVLRSAFGIDRRQDHCRECLTHYMKDLTKLFTHELQNTPRL